MTPSLNQQTLNQALTGIRTTLEDKIAGTLSTSQEIADPPALLHLCQTFHLSPFERDIVLLCAGMEFDSAWGALCAAAQGDQQRPYPTFSLALATLRSPHWDALVPTASLRRYRLIEVGTGTTLTSSPLRLDERILHYLAGVQHLDERLSLLAEPVADEAVLVASHQQLAEHMAQTWLQASGKLPLVQVCGSDSLSLKAVAAAACQQVGLTLHSLNGALVPVEASQLQILQCLCEREFHLSHTAWFLDCEPLETAEAPREAAISHLIETLNVPLILASETRRQQRQRPLVTFDIHNPSPAEQRHIWQLALGERAVSLNGQLEALVSHFNLSVPAIYSACLKAQALELDNDEPDSENNSKTTQNLWEICRNQARPRLDELAQRIEAKADWEDLILPKKEKQVLTEIAAHVRQRAKVYEQWEFGKKSHRGLGISALFSGASGTGKTTAAEILAHTLNLDIYRIDLSAIVSKYIGETEKNLRRVFDAAEAGGVILLFDEADALFGKRSDVKDSHDRHANVEVSYLLQRMETYRGLAILTTNLKGSIDQAFMRRIRFIVEFPFPDATQREEIWRRVFPAATPTQDLKFEKLAKLSVAGGNIRNIALNAAFIAADANEPVQMKHLLQAAQSEYIKMERPLTDVEVKGWV
jgi:SpoVK/Ycf46/Vps4 family AAA+-type ATPase